MSDQLYPFGARVPLSASFTDDSGTPADPGAVTLTVVAPDGSETSIAQADLTHPTVGTWSCDFTPTLPGQHYWRFDGTGANAGAVEGAFTVAPKLARPTVDATSYVGLAEFKAAPTYLALANLIPGGTAGQQDAELANALRRATAMLIAHCHQPLHARSVVERTRRRISPHGALRITLAFRPYRSTTSVSYGGDPANLTAADLTGLWVEQDDEHAAATLELANVSGCGQVHVTVGYVAGWPNTSLAAAAQAGATQLFVHDPAGIRPGDELRLWEPGVEETVTVAATYQPGSATVPLEQPVVNDHIGGAVISAIPADVREAVVLLACSLLVRPTAGDSGGGSFANAPRPASSRKDRPDVRAVDLRDQAFDLVGCYRRVGL